MQIPTRLHTSPGKTAWWWLAVNQSLRSLLSWPSRETISSHFNSCQSHSKEHTVTATPQALETRPTFGASSSSSSSSSSSWHSHIIQIHVSLRWKSEPMGRKAKGRLGATSFTHLSNLIISPEPWLLPSFLEPAPHRRPHLHHRHQRQPWPSPWPLLSGPGFIAMLQHDCNMIACGRL